MYRICVWRKWFFCCILRTLCDGLMESALFSFFGFYLHQTRQNTTRRLTIIIRSNECVSLSPSLSFSLPLCAFHSKNQRCKCLSDFILRFSGLKIYNTFHFILRGDSTLRTKWTALCAFYLFDSVLSKPIFILPGILPRLFQSIVSLLVDSIYSVVLHKSMLESFLVIIFYGLV